jgi:hypothetical protein
MQALWLRDVYLHSQDDLLHSLVSFSEVSQESEDEAQKELRKPFDKSKLFMTGNNIFEYLGANILARDKVLSIVIVGLRDHYVSNSSRLSDELQLDLRIAEGEPRVMFKDIFEYPSLSNMSDHVNIRLYQVIGTVTPFDVINIPADYLITCINNKQPINLVIPHLHEPLVLEWELYDLWNNAYQSVVDKIDL